MGKDRTDRTGDVADLDPDAFDLDAWIDGARAMRQTTTIYARGDLMARIDELVAELQQLPPGRDAEADVEDRALGEAPRSVVLRAELKELWGRYEASGVDFVLEQLSSTAMEEIEEQARRTYPAPAPETDTPVAAEAREKARGYLFGVEMVCRAVVTYAPCGTTPPPARALSIDQLKKMEQRFGVLEFSKLTAAARSLTYVGQVDVPFSQRVSAVLSENTYE